MASVIEKVRELRFDRKATGSFSLMLYQYQTNKNCDENTTNPAYQKHVTLCRRDQ